jgi:hypothetical protein
MIPLTDGAMLARQGYWRLREMMLRGDVRGVRGERGRLLVNREDCERLRDQASTAGAA